jgi:hypothetical protein
MRYYDSLAGSCGEKSINAGGPPTTREWNEFEAHLDRRPIRFVSAGVAKTGRSMKQLPPVSDEQASACGPRLLAAVKRLTREVAERGLLEDLVVAHAWCGCIKAIKDASEYTKAVAASEPVDGSDPKRESETTAAEAETPPTAR